MTCVHLLCKCLSLYHIFRLGNSGSNGGQFDQNQFFGGEDDLLDEEGLLLDTLSPVAVLARFRFSQSVRLYYFYFILFSICKFKKFIMRL